MTLAMSMATLPFPMITMSRVLLRSIWNCSYYGWLLYQYTMSLALSILFSVFTVLWLKSNHDGMLSFWAPVAKMTPEYYLLNLSRVLWSTGVFPEYLKYGYSAIVDSVFSVFLIVIWSGATPNLNSPKGQYSLSIKWMTGCWGNLDKHLAT